jgi:hypothetical protein
LRKLYKDVLVPKVLFHSIFRRFKDLFAKDLPQCRKFRTLLNREMPAQYPRLEELFSKSETLWNYNLSERELKTRVANISIVQEVQYKLKKRSICEFFRDTSLRLAFIKSGPYLKRLGY